MNDFEKKNICIIGYGSFGTAISILLAGKGHNVSVTDMNKELLENCRETSENSRYLSGARIPDGVNYIIDESGKNTNLTKALSMADIVVFAVPAQVFRNAFSGICDLIPDEAIVVDVAKGIEIESLKRLSEVAEEIKPKTRYVSLSGPSHAEEVGIALPTTVAVSSMDGEAAKTVQEAFSTDRFRVYTNNDIVGVELGGSLKNIMALGAGISDGLGFGDNAKAALMTRGMAEIKRLGLAIGAKEETFAGLTGVGDLIVTCTSMHSRNRRCGILIGQGVPVEDSIKEVGMVVEGVYTCEAACKLSDKLGVEMPITKSIKACLDGKITPREAIDNLMTRSLKSE
ncbi:MAG: NAD(P)-dependent glycerol-3-phosphate dehydrogenase [Firmicutes bacterium]|nr:NAD(P)-dependent glycerol-3-phosphate dehydrogenase [Bacillota bacterium]